MAALSPTPIVAVAALLAGAAAPAGGLASVSVGPVGGYLLVGVLAVLVIPPCTAPLYAVLVQADR